MNDNQAYLPAVDVRDTKVIKIGGVPQIVRIGHEEKLSHQDLIEMHERLMASLTVDHDQQSQTKAKDFCGCGWTFPFGTACPNPLHRNPQVEN